ncbi:UPF0715 family protein [Bacillus mojavensis]|uniref:UPF0715 family protein n=1 Tax=Bacillus mojavensis TaxID=72360 RepID=UPI002DB5B0D3|nr:UPF0715 family protein [Bacillus mojavensis]MEC1754394.1 UPF0715 family protein [Bacillus mojavensis]
MSLNQKTLNSYVYTLVFSSLSYGLVFGLYIFVYSDFMAIALITIGIIAFYSFITYLIFAFPLQLLLRRNPRKFSLIYFLIYTAVAFLAVFVFLFIDYLPSAFTVFRSLHYYIMSIAAALIYWFWDSICLQK